MTTQAQIEANRANAQKSTGPRTPEGKAKVAQNAVRHGLRAQQIVITGEDQAEFELYRDEMLQDLRPAGPVETGLAERVVNLSWRLRRAERVQATAVGTLAEDKKKWVWSQEDKQYVILQGTKPGPIAPGSEEEALAADRKVVKDFAEGRILDRLLVYEGRIEYHLYRTIAQLEKRQRLGRETGVSSSPGDVSGESGRTWNSANAEGSDGNSGLSVSADVTPPAVISTNVLEAEGQSCGTKPICAAPRSTGIPSASLSGQALPVSEDHRQDAHATEPRAGVTPGGTEVQGQARQTKPICDAACGTGIPSASLSGQALPASEDHGQDAHATEPPAGDTAGGVEAQSQSRKTNPICVTPRGTGGAAEAQSELCQTNPISVAPAVEMTHPAKVPSFQDSALLPDVQGPSRQTKPFCADTNDRPLGYRPVFRRRR